MKRSLNGVLTTHTGSLTRPPHLRQMPVDRDAGKPIDRAVFNGTVREAETRSS